MDEIAEKAMLRTHGHKMEPRKWTGTYGSQLTWQGRKFRNKCSGLVTGFKDEFVF
jgi:hypothetical protein